jgi:hypothetical protein
LKRRTERLIKLGPQVNDELVIEFQDISEYRDKLEKGSVIAIPNRIHKNNYLIVLEKWIKEERKGIE